MRICVLSSPPDPDDIPYDPSYYFTEYDWEHHTPHPRFFPQEIDRWISQGFDVFVNLCDGTPDDELPGLGLVKYLEERGVAFTGAGSAFFDPTRQQMKQAARENGIPIPGSVFVNDLAELKNFDPAMRYPLLVKPPNGYASVGLSRESCVSNQEELLAQTARTLQRFGGALIEEFIEGREFTTLVAENPDDSGSPVTFHPVEFTFPEGETFKHYDLKWKEYDLMSVHPVQDPALEAKLRSLTSRQFTSMEGTGYARCDFRMNASGDLFLLEINPNCGIFYPPHEPGSADFILQNDPRGHAGFLKLILGSALRRIRR